MKPNPLPKCVCERRSASRYLARALASEDRDAYHFESAE